MSILLAVVLGFCVLNGLAMALTLYVVRNTYFRTLNVLGTLNDTLIKVVTTSDVYVGAHQENFATVTTLLMETMRQLAVLKVASATDNPAVRATAVRELKNGVAEKSVISEAAEAASRAASVAQKEKEDLEAITQDVVEFGMPA